MRVRRSCLTVPGSSIRMLEKSASLPVDEVILDLEDSVAPSAKAEARVNILTALRQHDWGQKTVVVRINHIDSPWFAEDLEVVGAAAELWDAVMLPKVSKRSYVESVDSALSEFERRVGTPVGQIGMELQIEDPLGLQRVDDLIASSSRVETVVYGPGDFMAAMQLPSLTIGAAAGAAQLVVDAALVQLAFAARRNGIQVIDGPYAVIGDDEGLDRAASRVAGMGFDGKWVVHPSQIETCNRVFTPDEQLYERAKALLDAYDKSQKESGAGAATFGGEMIDEATRKMAEMTVQRRLRAIG
ncbi:HpcH/HpaI aldolase/citrate lyase family protein [Microbacterium sp. CH12i]|uniref:HpcH/HpaI aldolase/citrate lyase family protein n=1 Tax=Microbacterium sp. CH12i TaxID=1479651 RepID=UPI0005657570|nr:CoA ester lyase [Microbacterium sp. CH12i]